MYKTDTSYKGKYIWTVFDVRKGFRKKCTFICEASNRLTKNKYRLQREVHRTLEIAQTLMQRVVLLCSYAFVANKGHPTNFLKLEFDKIAQKNIRFSRNRCYNEFSNIGPTRRTWTWRIKVNKAQIYMYMCTYM